ncbi:MAG: DUF4139 domain-containing protein [Bacteroidetes bacterium]|nr:DUF4139 domain-containing protein [Bacteroidota bacterium]
MCSQNYFFIAVLILIAPYSAGAEQKQKVDIERATVFLSGAELISTAKVNLPKGESEVVFTNVASDVKPQSISVGANNGVVVEGTIFGANAGPEEGNSLKVQMWQDSISILAEEKEPLESKLSVITEQIGLIQSNNANTDNHLSTVELEKMLNLVDIRLSKLLDEKRVMDKRVARIDQKIARLGQQVAEEQSKRAPGGQLRVKFYAPAATSAEIRFSYVVQHAGWVPMYDLRVDKLNAPVKLYQKANVYQNCGVNWDNIRLVLSTGNTHEVVLAPGLLPVYLSIYTVPVVAQYKKPLIGRDIKSGSVENTADLVAIASPGIHPSRSGDELNSFGARGSATQFIVDGVVTNGVADYVQVDYSGVNTTYDIDLPYTVPSDGEEHMVAIKNYELPATYRYYAVPKKDNDVYLQAQVTNWEDLDLIPATTNIYYEGAFVGQGVTDARNIKDTMNFSLGRDKRIIISREIDKTKRSTKTIGTNVREEYAFNINVRNTRKEPITLTLLDQVPVSNDKEISVEDLAYKGGTLEEEKGEIKWLLNVKPNETKQLKLGYTVKYPKDKTIVMR